MEQPSRSCPHCKRDIPVPPDRWQHTPPWQCSHCAGLFGVGEAGLHPITAAAHPLWPLFTWAEARRFCFHAEKRFYVYAICYPNGLPFYIGKGRGYRVCQHHDEVFKEGNHIYEKHRIILQLLDRNEAEWYHFIALLSDERRAFAIEQFFIQAWGLRYNRTGFLANRVVPKTYVDCQGESFGTPQGRESIITDKSPRRIHHPSLLDGCGWDDPLDYNCPVCGDAVIVPKDLILKVVRCPQCAHFFKPEMSGFRRSQIIEFPDYRTFPIGETDANTNRLRRTLGSGNEWLQ